MSHGSGADSTGGSAEARLARLERARPLLLLLSFAAVSFAVLRGALHGPAVSDDLVYIVYNPYVWSLSLENILAIIDPWSPATMNTLNYAPVHLLLHALEYRFFEGHVFGYHVVNVWVHAVNCTLLVALLGRSGLPNRVALMGGVLFALHPANVEAVAWIFQLKTSVALGLCLGALLLQRRHPGLATLTFALALLTKVTAVFAIPMAAAFLWTQTNAAQPTQPGSTPPNSTQPNRLGAERRQWAWLGVWVGALALLAIPELTAFLGYGMAVEVPEFADPWVQARSIAAIGLRYLVMAVTSFGVSAFHEPAPTVSAADPWFLISLPVGALLTWRVILTARQRNPECASWIGAAAGFAPVSQIFPFSFPMADRYLYFILPGLIGGVLLSGQAIGRSAAWSRQSAVRREVVERGLRFAGIALAVFFALHSAQRARLWQDERFLIEDSARHYPEGGNAAYVEALGALERDDSEAALEALGRAVDRGYDRVRFLPLDPRLTSLRGTPGFVELADRIAVRHIEAGRKRDYSSQLWLRSRALAHRARGEFAEAAELLELAIRSEGPLEPALMIGEFMDVQREAAEARRKHPHAVERGRR
ncbi:MAG: hypothetical protein V3T01_12410 [Myxococcota bacterium]